MHINSIFSKVRDLLVGLRLSQTVFGYKFLLHWKYYSVEV